MPKEEGNKVNLKSLMVFTIIIYLILTVVCVTTYYALDWWDESSVTAQYQPKFMAPALIQKLQGFRQVNGRFPSNSQEFLNYLKVKNPIFVNNKGSFWIKNYVYSYQVLDGNKVILWAIPSPKQAQIAQSDADKLAEIEVIRAREKANSLTLFAVILPKDVKKYQGIATQSVTDIDQLPNSPTPNQLNSIGLFEKK